jgi:hypothetical protein
LAAAEDQRARESDILLLHHPHIRRHGEWVLADLALARLERVFLEEKLLELVRGVKVGLFRLYDEQREVSPKRRR